MINAIFSYLDYIVLDLILEYVLYAKGLEMEFYAFLQDYFKLIAINRKVGGKKRMMHTTNSVRVSDM